MFVMQIICIDVHSTHKTKVVNELSKHCQKVVIIDNFWVVRVVTVAIPYLVPKLGYLGNNFLVVNADTFDNFLDDNHKVVW